MPMDLSRDADSYVLNADLPGIDPASVDIDVDGQLLSIRAERPAPATEGVTWICARALHGHVPAPLHAGPERRHHQHLRRLRERRAERQSIPVAEKAKPRKIAGAVGEARAPAKAAKVKAAAYVHTVPGPGCSRSIRGPSV